MRLCLINHQINFLSSTFVCNMSQFSIRKADANNGNRRRILHMMDTLSIGKRSYRNVLQNPIKTIYENLYMHVLLDLSTLHLSP